MKPPGEGGQRRTIMITLFVAGGCIALLVAILLLVAISPNPLGSH